MNVLIIGGTGYLGYHATYEFLRHGHSVTAVARRPASVPELFPATVKVRLADINRLPDEAVQDLVRGHQAVVYAAGADASKPVQGSAVEFFYNENARATSRFFRLARLAGARRGVLIGSYFTYFDRTRPELHLSDNHPYIRSRREQAKESLAASLPDLELMVLELPWVFGATPGRPAKWKALVKYARSPWPLFFTAGGTNMIAVANVAEAIVNAIEHGQAGETYLIGDENLTWRDFFARLARIAGSDKHVTTIPTPVIRFLLGGYQLFQTLRGNEGGLVPAKFVDFQTSNSFFDPAPSRQALGYGQGGLEQAFQETVRAALNS